MLSRLLYGSKETEGWIDRESGISPELESHHYAESRLKSSSSPIDKIHHKEGSADVSFRRKETLSDANRTGGYRTNGSARSARKKVYSRQGLSYSRIKYRHPNTPSQRSHRAGGILSPAPRELARSTFADEGPYHNRRNAGNLPMPPPYRQFIPAYAPSANPYHPSLRVYPSPPGSQYAPNPKVAYSPNITSHFMRNDNNRHSSPLSTDYYSPVSDRYQRKPYIPTTPSVIYDTKGMGVHRALPAAVISAKKEPSEFIRQAKQELWHTMERYEKRQDLKDAVLDTIAQHINSDGRAIIYYDPSHPEYEPTTNDRSEYDPEQPEIFYTEQSFNSLSRGLRSQQNERFQT
jgi:hypothetical protein